MYEFYMSQKPAFNSKEVQLILDALNDKYGSDYNKESGIEILKINLNKMLEQAIEFESNCSYGWTKKLIEANEKYNRFSPADIAARQSARKQIEDALDL